MNSKRLVALIVFSGILAFATSASAECAWVLWQRVDSCDNPPCVRPDHLVIGTAQDDADDRVNAELVGESPLRDAAGLVQAPDLIHVLLPELCASVTLTARLPSAKTGWPSSKARGCNPR